MPFLPSNQQRQSTEGYTRWIPVSSTQWCKVPMIMWYKLLKIKCLKLYFLNHFSLCCDLPSVLWRCWLGGRKGIRPGGWVLVWLSVWSEVQTCICPSWCHCHSLSLASVKSRLILPSWYQLNPGSPGQRAVKRMCVCVVIIKRTCVLTVCLCINYGATVAWEWEVVGLTSQLVQVKLWTMQHMNTCIHTGQRIVTVHDCEGPLALLIVLAVGFIRFCGWHWLWKLNGLLVKATALTLDYIRNKSCNCLDVIVTAA